MNTHDDCLKQAVATQTLYLEDIAQMLRLRPADAHKGTMGHALLVAGSKGMAGAAILACRACLHSGIGKLTLHTPQANHVILQCAAPEAILSLDKNENWITTDIPTITFQAIGIGPGLGTQEETAQALMHYLDALSTLADKDTSSTPLVLDADALNIIAQHRGWENCIPRNSILTPHVGEFERLTHRCKDAGERLGVALNYAMCHEVYIVLKGHPSIVVTPEGNTYACPYGNSGMATPGSGDVLTGVITGLLAQGYAPLQATLLGTWLHALAGDEAAKDLGEEYMLASDIVTHLSQAYSLLKNQK